MRIGNGSLSRGVHRDPRGQSSLRVVFVGGAAGHHDPDQCGRVVKRHRPGEGESTVRRMPDYHPSCPAANGDHVDPGADRVHFFEVLLPGEPHQLLHVLPDGQVPRVRPEARRSTSLSFLGAVAAGTIIGGPIGDRIGRKYVIWCSILGVLPFTLILPYAQPVLDRRICSRDHRTDSGVGVFGDSGLCSGPGSGKSE